jgi:hypothetical protein
LNWLRERWKSFRRVLVEQTEKSLATALVGLGIVALATVRVFFRDRLDDELALPLWIVLIGAASLLLNLCLGVWARLRRRPRYVDVEVPLFGIVFRVGRWSLRHLDSLGERAMRERLGQPLCLDRNCRAEVRTDHIPKNCPRCHRRFSAAEFPVHSLREWAIDELRRLHRTRALKVRQGRASIGEPAE